MRICVADGEREQHKQLMDNLERRLHANHIVFWLRENYMLGTSGSLSKRSVYNHYLSVTKQANKKALISPTFFGKLVKRAFPAIKCNRKGPRGQTKQHYTCLQRIEKPNKDDSVEFGIPMLSSLQEGSSPSSSAALPVEAFSEDADDALSPIHASTKLFSGLSENNEEVSFLASLMPMKARSFSTGGTSSRSSSPADELFEGRESPTSDLDVSESPKFAQHQPLPNAQYPIASRVPASRHQHAPYAYCSDCSHLLKPTPVQQTTCGPTVTATTTFRNAPFVARTADVVKEEKPDSGSWYPICDEESAFDVRATLPVVSQASVLTAPSCASIPMCPPPDQIQFSSLPQYTNCFLDNTLANNNGSNNNINSSSSISMFLAPCAPPHEMNIGQCMPSSVSGLACPTSPPSVEFTLSYDEDWANWLLD